MDARWRIHYSADSVVVFVRPVNNEYGTSIGREYVVLAPNSLVADDWINTNLDPGRNDLWRQTFVKSVVCDLFGWYDLSVLTGKGA